MFSCRADIEKSPREYLESRAGGADIRTTVASHIKTNECELCNCKLTGGNGLIGKRHLDHDHETGLFRNILCGKCNINEKRNNKKLKSSVIINEESGDTQ